MRKLLNNSDTITGWVLILLLAFLFAGFSNESKAATIVSAGYATNSVSLGSYDIDNDGYAIGVEHEFNGYLSAVAGYEKTGGEFSYHSIKMADTSVTRLSAGARLGYQLGYVKPFVELGINKVDATLDYSIKVLAAIATKGITSVHETAPYAGAGVQLKTEYVVITTNVIVTQLNSDITAAQANVMFGVRF